MTKTIETLFDFVSPNGYLVWGPLKALAACTGSELVITPVFLGGMHKLTGNAPPFARDAPIKGKNDYAMLEIRRFIAKHGLSRFRMSDYFPMNTITVQRMLLAAIEQGRGIEFIDFMLPKVWEDNINIADPEVLAPLFVGSGFDGAELFKRTQDQAIKDRLIANTEHAVARGAFGIPTFYIGDEMFFGKERLGQMEELLTEKP